MMAFFTAVVTTVGNVDDYAMTKSLPGCLIGLLGQFLYMGISHVITRGEEEEWKDDLAAYTRLLGPIIAIGLNQFKVQATGEKYEMYRFSYCFIYHTIFFCQGAFDMTFINE